MRRAPAVASETVYVVDDTDRVRVEPTEEVRAEREEEGAVDEQERAEWRVSKVDADRL